MAANSRLDSIFHFSVSLLRLFPHKETTLFRKVITIVPQIHYDMALLCPSVYCFAPLRDRLNLMFSNKSLAYVVPKGMICWKQSLEVNASSKLFPDSLQVIFFAVVSRKKDSLVWVQHHSLEIEHHSSTSINVFKFRSQICNDRFSFLSLNASVSVVLFN